MGINLEDQVRFALDDLVCKITTFHGGGTSHRKAVEVLRMAIDTFSMEMHYELNHKHKNDVALEDLLSGEI